MSKTAIVCEWLKLAIEDLRYAEIGLQHGAEPRYIAFHAQQAAEKALKEGPVGCSGCSSTKNT